MALPEAVQKMADLADDIEKSMTQQQVTEPEEPTKEVQSVEPDELEKMHRRYSSLKGKYDAEVPRLTEQVRATEQRVTELSNENEELRRQLAQAEEKQTYITTEDTDRFGEDVVDLVRRGAMDEASKYERRIAELEAMVSNLKGQTEQVRQEHERVSASTMEREFYRELSNSCAQWAELNTDEGFNAWLDETDELYGFARREALNRAVSSADGAAAGRLFNEYLRLTQQNRSPLEKQVAPSRTHASAYKAAPTAWTSSKIEQFYSDVQHGRYTREQAQQIEREIDEAVASGRVLS